MLRAGLLPAKVLFVMTAQARHRYPHGVPTAVPHSHPPRKTHARDVPRTFSRRRSRRLRLPKRWRLALPAACTTAPPPASAPAPLLAVPHRQQKEPVITVANNSDGQRHPRTSLAEIQVPAGAWRFRRSPRNAGRVNAELVFRGEKSTYTTAVYGTEGTLWGIEGQLGFALPTAIQEILQHAPETRPAKTRVSPPSPWIRSADYQPWRASKVLAPDMPAVTYGFLMNLNGPIRTWEHGPYRIDAVSTTLTFEDEHSPSLQLAYRIWHDERVIFASDTLPVALGSDLESDTTLRRIAKHALDGRSARPYTPQREFLTRHGAELRSVLAPPTAPYPIGTRVKVRGLTGTTPASGIITDAILATDGSLHYGWRPDVARLPGHPMGRLLEWQLLAPAQHVQPTLHAPDAALTSTQAPDVLVYGAKIRTIDDPRFATGTVLRAILRPGGQPTYDVQPDDGTPGPVRIHAANVEPVAGTAWPTVQALLDARTEAGIPLETGELLVTLREATFVADGPTGPRPALPPQEWPSHDPILDPDSPDIPSSPKHGMPPTAAPPRIVIEDEYVRVYDPRHELLVAPNRTFEAALSHPREKLVELLTAAPHLYLGGEESLVTLAALAAQHFPHKINTIPTPSTEEAAPEAKPINATDPNITDLNPSTDNDPEPPDLSLGP